MPPEMSVSMRHTKLKAEEAALLAGELSKPSWQSRNEGIHERVSFEDAIWGFDLAGGSYYKTPLRVTHVKPDSRAEKAGIRPGDKLLRINDIDTSTLTIQEAHQIIIESGIHLKIAVTAPEDEEDAYFCYEDPIEDGYDSEEERRLEEEKARKRQVQAKVSSYWSLQWPWVSKRRIIYRESNCFMVPSKYEDKHREQFPTQPSVRIDDSIVFDGANSRKERKRVEIEERVEEDGVEVITSQNSSKSRKNHSQINGNVDNNNNHLVNGNSKIGNHLNGSLNEIAEESDIDQEFNDQIDNEVKNDDIESEYSIEENIKDIEEHEQIQNVEDSDVQIEEEVAKDDEIIEKLLNGNNNISEIDDDKLLDRILSDSEETLENSIER